MNKCKLLRIIVKIRKWCKSSIRSVEKNFEAIGLSLILLSFGWQCFEEHSDGAVYESHIYTINEKLNAIGDALYNDVVHSEWYQDVCMKQGRVVSNWYDYDNANKNIFKDWKGVKEELGLIESQRDIGWRLRVILFIIGSVLVIIPKYQK